VDLLQRDQLVISKHLENTLAEGELSLSAAAKLCLNNNIQRLHRLCALTSPPWLKSKFPARVVASRFSALAVFAVQKSNARIASIRFSFRPSPTRPPPGGASGGNFTSSLVCWHWSLPWPLLEFGLFCR
jgi:hypothetical protein